MTIRTTHQRQYQRHSVDVRVQLTICESDQAQVAPLAGGSLPARMTNISAGGAHVITPTFLPRAAQAVVEIPVGANLPAGRVRARIVKVQMLSREPLYGLGLRFEDPDCDVVRALQASEEDGGAKP